jgi:hypothetical protein
MRDITLETDSVGIWLLKMTPEGANQIGHVSWHEITRRIQDQLLQEKFLMALAKIDEEDGLL